MSFFQPPKDPLPPGYPLPAVDSRGVPVAAGDLVTIDSIPDWLTHDLPYDEVARLKACQGTRMRIYEIDAYGYIWFENCGPWFSLRPCEVTAVDRRE
jgi:hypothetical protein